MKEKEQVKKGTVKKELKYRILASVTLVAMTIYLGWRLFYTLPDFRVYGWVAFVAAVVLVAAEALSAIEGVIQYIDLGQYMEPEMPEIPLELYPDVDVFIATHNEETELLFKTANACKYMKYPDPAKVHIYLCDDGDRAEVAKMAASLGVGYIGLSGNTKAKAGNLNNALSKTTSPLIATFDADMIPSSDFLMETVPYFFLPQMKKDEDGEWVLKAEEEIDPSDKIGFIQTPQTFYNPDVFQYNLYSEKNVPNEQDFFFHQINVSRNHSNSPIYAGSNTVISREALEEVGGIAVDTITEDFETGIRIQAKGYKCYAVDKQLAKGLAPTSVDALVKQRERWARGCIHSLRKVLLLLNPEFPLRLKISYMACRIYWGSFTRRLVYIFSPLLYTLLGIPVVISDLKGLVCIWLPSYLLYSITLRKMSGNIRNSRWSNVVDTIMFPYLVLPIWAEVLFVKKTEFHVTNKNRTLDKENSAFMALPYGILLLLSLIGLFIAVQNLVVYNAMGAVIIIYWLLVNMFSLLMAILFMQGRVNERMSERFEADMPVIMEFENTINKGHIIDISEGGFAFLRTTPIYLPHEETQAAIFFIHTHDYEATMTGHITSVTQRGDKWKYGVCIDEMSEDSRKEYLQIVYDRPNTLPQTITAKSSYLGDILTNLNGRARHKADYKRQLPRIIVEEETVAGNGSKVMILNFNYEYVRLKPVEDVRLRSNLVLFPGTDSEMICVKTKINPTIYEVTNIEELMHRAGFLERVEGWISHENA